MPKSDLLPVKKFARLLHIPESTIRYYDRIGLLPATVRGENSYRYYSTKQVATANVIRMLQEFGIPLGEIKSILKKRSPEFTITLIKKQMEIIESNIVKLNGKKNLLSDIYDIIYPSLNIDEDAVYLQQLEETRIIRGELNNYDNADDFDAMFKFYEYAYINYPCLCFYYPVWGVFSEKRVKMRDWKWPDRYYICSNFGHDVRQKSLYAIGHTRCWYGDGGILYEKMLKYIDDNGLELCGDVYEEYPLNEFCNINEKEYLMRLLMPVRKK